jgi:predicted ATPase/class 3 adenylate cyclase
LAVVGLPRGTVTLLFTDIEGSTRLLQELGSDPYVRALEDHRRLLRQAMSRHGGVEVEMQGDSFHFAFSEPRAAVLAAAEAQRALAGHRWESQPIRVRMGMHTGEPLISGGLYAGLDVHRAARVMSAGHGGQVLLSESTRAMVAAELPEGHALRDLGEHRLKDLLAPQRLYQLGEEEFPPIKSLYRTTLPVAATPFLGRERELQEVVTLLADEDVRLLTLTGAGGSGKTRLAAQAAADVSELYPDGTFWVGLAGLREPAFVTSTIAQVLGAKESLAEHIGSKRLLLLLDNFEHLLSAAAELSELLGACPNVTLLATSRESLHLRSEREYVVLPLREADAVALFHERARASGVGVAADREATEICRRLDHLPLAIELAAARVKVLPPAAMLERLEQRLPLLTGGAGDLPARQRTLRATIDWSYDLLDAGEQSLFARLAVFRGGCTLDAAEEVCEADLDTLQSLVEKSLLRHADGRFWMLETIREFARERLRDLGEEGSIARRHASYFLKVARETEDRLSGPEQAALLQALEREHDNERAAFDWAVKSDVETALALGHALQRLWYLHGYAREGLGRLAAALDRDEKTPPLIRARALRTAGTLAEACSEFTRARELLGESITLLRGLDQEKELATSLNNQAAIAAQQGDHEVARRAYEESLELKRALGDATGILVTSSNLAILEGKLGEYEVARRRHDEILPSLRELGSPYALSNCLASLGEIALLCGDRIGARTMLEESLELRRQVGDKAGMLESQALLSRADCADGDRESAELRVREGLEIAQEIDDPGMLVAVLEARADLEAFFGDAARAIALRAAAERMRSEIGAHFFKADMTWRDRAISDARRRLSGGGYEQSCAQGEAASVAEVLAWAQVPLRVSAAAAR